MAILGLVFRWMLRPEQKWFLCAGFLFGGLLLTNQQESILILPGLIFVAAIGNRNLGRDLAFSVLPLGAILMSQSQFGLWIVFPNFWNWPSMFAFTSALLFGVVLAIVTRGVGTSWKFALLCNVSLLIGISFYLLLPFASMTNPPMNWGYARTTDGFFHMVSRGQFERANPTSNLSAYAYQLWMFGKMAGKELGWFHFFLPHSPSSNLPERIVLSESICSPSLYCLYARVRHLWPS
jgi:hypothetical protein